MRPCSNIVYQGSRKDAEHQWNFFGCVVGVCPNPAEGIRVAYLSRGVRDEDTPTPEDLDAWTEFALPYLRRGQRVLVHCEAGQNRSACIAALLVTLSTGVHYDTVASRLHTEFLECDPPHNWQPYEHWRMAILNWLDNGDRP